MKEGDLIRWVGDSALTPLSDDPDGCLGIILEVVPVRQFAGAPTRRPDWDEVHVYFTDGCLEKHPTFDLVIINEIGPVDNRR